MPATFAAVRAALRAAGPELRPATLLDLGGGTGAAVWAAAATLPSLLSAHVLDGSAPALALGRTLAAHAPDPVLAGATWTQARWPAELPAADLVTLAYFLGELPAAEQVAVVAAAAAGPAPSRSSNRARRPASATCCGPGTPCSAPVSGSSRPARTTRPAHGRTARTGATSPPGCRARPGTGRSRAARLGWEDEKFSYVVAVRDGGTRAAGPDRAAPVPAQGDGRADRLRGPARACGG